MSKAAEHDSWSDRAFHIAILYICTLVNVIVTVNIEVVTENTMKLLCVFRKSILVLGCRLGVKSLLGRSCSWERVKQIQCRVGLFRFAFYCLDTLDTFFGVFFSPLSLLLSFIVRAFVQCQLLTFICLYCVGYLAVVAKAQFCLCKWSTVLPL